jgi:hypothetical protein
MSLRSNPGTIIHFSRQGKKKRRGVVAVMGLIHQVVMIMCLNATLGIRGGGREHGEMFKIDNFVERTEIIALENGFLLIE